MSFICTRVYQRDKYVHSKHSENTWYSHSTSVFMNVTHLWFLGVHGSAWRRPQVPGAQGHAPGEAGGVGGSHRVDGAGAIAEFALGESIALRGVSGGSLAPHLGYLVDGGKEPMLVLTLEVSEEKRDFDDDDNDTILLFSFCHLYSYNL